MNKPDFFIVGAAKAGTTSLYEYLKQHPGIYFSPVKEPNYFSTDIDVNEFSSAYRKNTFLDVDAYFSDLPLKPLQLTYVRKEEHYQMLFEGVTSKKVIGEASTSYLVSEVAAKSIREYNPEAKIIAVLRNPISRAFSHYLMALRYGHTRLSFREALEKDINTEPKGIGKSEMFLEFGMYATQLKRYYEVFPESQVKVIFFENLVENPDEVLKEVQAFLNVENMKLDTGRSHNEAKIPKFPLINKIVAQSGLKKILKAMVKGKTIEKLKSTMFDSGKGKRINEKDKKLLIDSYENEIDELAAMTKTDLSHWKN
jgi:hypothetical protein